MNNIASLEQYNYWLSPEPLSISMETEFMEESTILNQNQEEVCQFPLYLLDGLSTPIYDDDVNHDSQNEWDGLDLLINAFVNAPMDFALVYYYALEMIHLIYGCQQKDECTYCNEVEPSYFDEIEAALHGE